MLSEPAHADGSHGTQSHLLKLYDLACGLLAWPQAHVLLVVHGLDLAPCRLQAALGINPGCRTQLVSQTLSAACNAGFSPLTVGSISPVPTSEAGQVST